MMRRNLDLREWHEKRLMLAFYERTTYIKLQLRKQMNGWQHTTEEHFPNTLRYRDLHLHKGPRSLIRVVTRSRQFLDATSLGILHYLFILLIGGGTNKRRNRIGNGAKKASLATSSTLAAIVDIDITISRKESGACE